MASVSLQLNGQEATVNARQLFDLCTNRGILRFNPRTDGMFKQRVLSSDANTIKSWLSAVFKLNFKELWTRSASTEATECQVGGFETHSEFINQTAESIVQLAKVNGLEIKESCPQHIHVDSRYFIEWELSNGNGEAINVENISGFQSRFSDPEKFELFKDILTRGAEVVGEMQVKYQENFGTRLDNYDRKLEHPADKIDEKGASSSSGSVPLSHIVFGLCAWDDKKINKDISDDQRTLMKSIKTWSGALDINSSRGRGSLLSTIFLGSPVKKKLNGQSLQDFQEVVDKELRILRQKLAKTYGYDVNDFDNYDSIPGQLVEVYDWLVYFGFGEVLSDNFVENIKTNVIKEALNNMKVSVDNVTDENVRDQMSGLWFDEQEIQQEIQKEIQKLQQENAKLAERVSQSNALLEESRDFAKLVNSNTSDGSKTPGNDTIKRAGNLFNRIVEFLSKKTKV